jgi:hypothetical protein
MKLLPLLITPVLALFVACPQTQAPKTYTINPTGTFAAGEKSTVGGTVTVADMGGGKTRVTVTLAGLTPNTTHANHFHQGSCASNGGVVVGFTDLKSDANGRASLTQEIETAKITANAYYAVHQKSSADGVGGLVGCGDLK